MDYLQGLQDAINKQDPQAIAANTQVNDAVNTVQQEMKLTGIDLNPEAGSAQEKQLAQAESGLRDRIIAAQQANNGKPLTSGEVHNLAMGYFADQVLKGGMVGKSGDGKQAQAQGGAPSGNDMNNQGGIVLPRIDHPALMPHGAPVAAGTMADEHKSYPAALEVGKQMPNGSIAAGDDPDSRVYVVKAKGKGKAVTLDTISAETGYDFDQLKALNDIDHDGVWSISNGQKIILPSHTPKDNSSTNHTPVIDIEKTTKKINDDKKDKFTGNCGTHVFDAIVEGLPEDQKKLFQRTRYAKDAGPSLEKVGFKKVLTSSDQLGSYTPQKGDVVVLQDYPHQGHYIDLKDKDGKRVMDENGKPKQVWKDVPAGHIAIFDGKYWVSDKRQDGASRIWAGPSFEENNVGMAIYRP